ncbi:lysosomal thioesterase PPT2 homolog isoform X2 [Spodoptera litura]|uniref:palmitoyl-CoA hydrolase n=1 Tax=Spodoptera litura TaxID=69820 RepID=A0A9J7E2T3_SPOLT|nr:lysosomal thioesterase PPT2 homolog isoform X2 [Spodoptera litura]
MAMKIVILSILFFIVPILSYKPVVLIHGVMTGSASMELIKLRIEEQHPGTIVYNVNRFESWSSLETMWHQVLEIGMDIANISSRHPDGINLIGYSQGGLIARGIVETFPNVSVSTFISLSSPQAGQYGAGFLHLVFPGLVKDTVYELFYSRVGQHTSVGNYWNDPYHQSLYESYSVYLPYINNHLPQFGYYNANETIIEMKAQDIYVEDKIGLRTLDETGRLHVVTVPGVNHFNWHMNMSIVDDYLLPFLD